MGAKINVVFARLKDGHKKLYLELSITNKTIYLHTHQNGIKLGVDSISLPECMKLVYQYRHTIRELGGIWTIDRVYNYMRKHYVKSKSYSGLENIRWCRDCHRGFFCIHYNSQYDVPLLDPKWLSDGRKAVKGQFLDNTKSSTIFQKEDGFLCKTCDRRYQKNAKMHIRQCL